VGRGKGDFQEEEIHNFLTNCIRIAENIPHGKRVRGIKGVSRTKRGIFIEGGEKGTSFFGCMGLGAGGQKGTANRK